MQRVAVQREQRSLVGIQTKALELAESVDGLIEAINRVSAEADGSSKCERRCRAAVVACPLRTRASGAGLGVGPRTAVVSAGSELLLNTRPP